MKRIAVVAVAVFGAIVAAVTTSSAAFAVWPTLTNSNYSCGDPSTPYMSCMQSGGGQVVTMTGTDLQGCTAIIQMGFGWSGSVPVTVAPDGSSITFTVPDAWNFQGWALFDCGFNPSSFLFQTATDVAVTADSPADITVADAAPTVSYTSNPATNAPDWTTIPTCAVYDPADLTTPLTSFTIAGTYVTHCKDGVKTDSGNVSYVDGQLVVTEVPTPDPTPDPPSGGSGDGTAAASGGLPMTGASIATLSSLAVLATLFFIGAGIIRRGRTRLGIAASNNRLSGLLASLNAGLGRLERPRR